MMSVWGFVNGMCVCENLSIEGERQRDRYSLVQRGEEREKFLVLQMYSSISASFNPISLKSLGLLLLHF